MKYMTTVEYREYRMKCQKFCNGATTHDINTFLGKMVDIIWLLDKWEGREDKAEDAAYYYEKYKEAKSDCDAYIKKLAINQAKGK